MLAQSSECKQSIFTTTQENISKCFQRWIETPQIVLFVKAVEEPRRLKCTLSKFKQTNTKIMLFKAKSQCLQPLNKSRDNLHTSLDVVSLLASTSCDLTYKGIQICYKLSTYQPYTPEIFWQSWSYQSNSNFQCLLKVLLDKYRLTTTRQLFVGIEIDGDVCVSRWRQRMIDTFNTNPTIVGQKTSSEM